MPLARSIVLLGQPLGAQVQANGAAALGDGAKLWLVKLGLTIPVDSRLFVHTELDAVNVRALCQHARQACCIVRGQNVGREAPDHRLAVVVSVLRPYTKSEVQPAQLGTCRDAPEHVEAIAALLRRIIECAHLGKLWQIQQERIGRRHVGNLVPKCEAQVVVTVERQLIQVFIPELPVVKPFALQFPIAEEELHAAPTQVGRANFGGNIVEDGSRGASPGRRCHLDGPARLPELRR